MDTIIFRYLTSIIVFEGLDMHLMDVVTTYLYGSIDSDIYMKIPEGFKLPETTNPKPRNMYSIKLQRSLYTLKQFKRMWYNRLSEYLLKKRICEQSNLPMCFYQEIKNWAYNNSSIYG